MMKLLLRKKDAWVYTYVKYAPDYAAICDFLIASNPTLGQLFKQTRQHSDGFATHMFISTLLRDGVFANSPMLEELQGSFSDGMFYTVDMQYETAKHLDCWIVPTPEAVFTVRCRRLIPDLEVRVQVKNRSIVDIESHNFIGNRTTPLNELLVPDTHVLFNMVSVHSMVDFT